jgi:hypothetical protein
MQTEFTSMMMVLLVLGVLEPNAAVHCCHSS